MTKLSIVVLSYNTCDLLVDCLNSLEKLKQEADFEIIVSDNGSTDGSIDTVKKDFKKVILIENGKNLGFAAGNNAARKIAKGKYVLFLNSDTIVHKNTLKKTVEYLDNNSDVGAVTCKTVLPSGELDRDARRAFPTPWVAISHFAYLDRIWPASRIFSKYWYGYLSPDVTHEIDVLQGAYCLIKRSILDKVDWFDEDYFLDGEDIDLCWKVKQLGYKIIYFPEVSITHVKKASKRKLRKISISTGVKSMEIFYRKHLWDRYPFYVNYLVLLGIKFMDIVRSAKLALSK